MARPATLLALVGCLTLIGPVAASGFCDFVESLNDRYRGALGESTRSFAAPGRTVELIVRSICGFGATSAAPDLPGPASQYAVSVIYTPLRAGAPRNLVVLRDDCTGIAANACTLQGSPLPNGGAVTCIETSLAIEAVPLPGGGFENHLEFAFPNTDALVAPDGDRNGLTGPAKLVATRASDPLPCAAAAALCADLPPATLSQMVTCIDELYDPGAACRTGPGDLHRSFVGFTALPVENRWEDVCVEDAGDPNSVCTANGDSEIRFALDRLGNAWVPMNYGNALVRVDGEPFPILVEGQILSAAVEAGVDPPDFSRTEVLSFGLNGALLDPVFQAVEGGIGEVFGTVDAASGAHEGLRFSPSFRQCSDDGGPCNEDADCPSGQAGTCVPATCQGVATPTPCTSHGQCLALGGTSCGPPLFDLEYLVTGGGCGSGILASRNQGNGSTTLLSLTQGSSIDPALLVQRSEPVAGVNVNFDADQDDPTVELKERGTGATQRIGQAGATGRAVTELALARLGTQTAVDLEGECIAFAEGEPLEGNQDVVSNGEVFDSRLAVFCLDETGSAEARDLSPYPDVAVEVEPVVSSKSVVVSEGRVFARFPDAADAPRDTTLLSRSTNPSPGDAFSVEADLSADSEVVVFASAASNLLGPGADGNGVTDVFRHDRTSGSTTRASVPDGSCFEEEPEESDGASLQPSTSGDGRYVAFTSLATNLVAGDVADASEGVYVHDVDACTTVRVGGGAGLQAREPSLSDDGRYVAYRQRDASPLAGDDWDVVVVDRDSDGNGVFGDTPLAIVDETIATGDSTRPSLSPQGTEVAFQSQAADLVAGDANGVVDVFVSAMGAVTVRSVDSDGLQGGQPSGAPDCADGCERVAFESDAALSDADTNPGSDVYLNDAATGLTTRVSTDSLGNEVAGSSLAPAISAQGRYVAFQSGADTLVPGDGNGATDVFVKDTLTGFVKRVSVDGLGVEGDGDSTSPAISADGLWVSFVSESTNLVPVVAESNVFVRGPSSPAVSTDFATRIGVLDTRAAEPELAIFDPASRVVVDSGNAAYLSEGDEVHLLRFTCGGLPAEPSCNESSPCDAQECLPVVESLMRPGAGLDLSDEYLVARVTDTGAAGPTAAAHRLGDDPANSLDDILIGGSAAEAVDVQVCGSFAVLQAPGGQLFSVDLDAGLVASPVLDGDGLPVFAEDFFLGEPVRESGQPERCLGVYRVFDQTIPEGPSPDCTPVADEGCDRYALFLLGLEQGVAPETVDCGISAIPCTVTGCIFGAEFGVSTEGSSAQVLVSEAHEFTSLLNDDPAVELLVATCNVAGATTVVNSYDPATATQNPVAPGTTITVGQSTRRCSNDLAVVCTSDGDCDGGVCGAQPTTSTDPDNDKDGIRNSADLCPDTPDPTNADFDGDLVGDACDAFTCGNGEPEPFESCDEGSENGQPGSDCSETCTPAVRMEVVNPLIFEPKTALVFVIVLGSEELNLSTEEMPGLDPPSMALRVDDPANPLLLSAVDPDTGECLPGGAEPAVDLSDPTIYEALTFDLNHDGIESLKIPFRRAEIGLDTETEKLCLRGALSGVTGETGLTRFVATDRVRVVACGLGFELVLVIAPLAWLRGRLRRWRGAPRR